MTWTAYIDEAMRAEAKVYVLAAACLDSDELATARTAVTQLVRPGRRFHWRDQEPPDRLKAVSVVAGLSALHLVVVAAPLDPRRQERARRHCLRRMLFELNNAGVERVWMESRGRRQDLRDMQAVNAFNIQGVIGSTPRVGHAYPSQEPLLWLPDIVAGAVGGQLARGEQYAVELEAVITRYHVELR